VFGGDIPPISEEFSAQIPAQLGNDVTIAVVYVAWSKAKGTYLTPIVDTQM
jgi:hypothetical protein